MLTIRKKLSKEQKERGIIFSSCLSTQRFEDSGDTTHELTGEEKDYSEQRRRLLDVSFFRNSPFKYHIIRQ